MPILADYSADFQPLSDQHVVLLRRASEILDAYRSGALIDLTYAAIGTFGAGKTQFLYWLHRKSLDQGLVPILILAEDLFAEIIRKDRTFTQGDVAALVHDKVSRFLGVLRSGRPKTEVVEELRALTDPRSNLGSLLEAVVNRFSGIVPESARPVLLVDELEGQYRSLQQEVRTPGDRSPLRELFDKGDKPYLKFFALAPAGIYEMGGADQTRANRIVIPPADIRYVRTHLIEGSGRANACWWLSRGKARHLFKACSALRDAPSDLGAGQVNRILRNELDLIGQPPTEVPAAVTEGLAPSKWPALMNLAPVVGDAKRSYIIDVRALCEGELAERVVDAFELHNDVAILFAEYFRATAMALSNNDLVTFVPEKELPDLLSLTLDHLLEYEYGNRELTPHMGDVLNLYEKISSEQAAVHGVVGRLWPTQQNNCLLPLTISEIRRAFPFPLMNPIVKGHNPDEMKRKWEGKGLPLWRWQVDRVICWFFASARDMGQFIDSDEFVSNVLPDGASGLCLVPPDGSAKQDNRLAEWCQRNGKLKVEQLPQLLADFLLSGSGDLAASLPGDLTSHLKSWSTDKSDVLLTRKANIYDDALCEIVRGTLRRPRLFCADSPPDTDTVWGSSQVADRTVAVSALSLAWTDLTAEQQQTLIRLRDLFRSGKDSRGAGDLNRLKPRPGIIGIADDLFPRQSRTKMPSDAPAMLRIKDYWPSDTRTELVSLALLTSIERFLKLVGDENCSRLLESLWRSTRANFSFKDGLQSLDSITRNMESEILPTLQQCIDLEKRAKECVSASGIEFEEHEVVVKAIGGFRQLLEMMKSADANAAAYRAVLELFGSSIDVAKSIKALRTKCDGAQRAIDRLDRCGKDLIDNSGEYCRAVKYLGVDQESLSGVVQSETAIGQTCNLVMLVQEVTSRAERLEEMSGAMAKLQKQLDQLGETLGEISVEGDSNER